MTAVCGCVFACMGVCVLKFGNYNHQFNDSRSVKYEFVSCMMACREVLY